MSELDRDDGQRSLDPANVVAEIPVEAHYSKADAIDMVITCLEHLVTFLRRNVCVETLEPVQADIEAAVDTLRGLACQDLPRNTPPATTAPAGLAPWQVRAIGAHISDRMHERITIGALAQTANLSASHFARMFQQSFGITPMRHLRLERVERAKQLLADSKLPLVDIAEQCGFADQAHFTRIFQRVAGMTPRRWRLQAA